MADQTSLQTENQQLKAERLALKNKIELLEAENTRLMNENAGKVQTVNPVTTDLQQAKISYPELEGLRTLLTKQEFELKTKIAEKHLDFDTITARIQSQMNECFKVSFNKVIGSLQEVCEGSVQDCKAAIEELGKIKYDFAECLEGGGYEEDDKDETLGSVTGKIQLEEFTKSNWSQLDEQLQTKLIQ